MANVLRLDRTNASLLSQALLLVVADEYFGGEQISAPQPQLHVPRSGGENLAPSFSQVADILSSEMRHDQGESEGEAAEVAATRTTNSKKAVLQQQMRGFLWNARAQVQQLKTCSWGVSCPAPRS